MKSTTIAAISTAQGESGIGVIRVSGDEAIEICDRVFKAVSGKKLSEMKGYSAAFGHIYKENEAIDECVATVFRNPKSYTGEDVVELSCHGGIYITRETLRAVLEQGASPAQAGEFTKRAFLNGKLDLTEAEAVIDIISAKSKNAARAALYAKDGALWKRTEAIKNKLVTTAAHLSAWVDYPEEDIEKVTEESLRRVFSESIEELDRLLKTYDAGQTVKEGIDTVIAGKPNTGKSTLMNLLAGHDRSIVTDIPGTTRDIIVETVLVGGIMLRLSDTAGIRDTGDAVEKIGVELAKSRLENCGLVLAVFDDSKPLDENDLSLLEKLDAENTIAIINKTDLESKLDSSPIENKLNDVIRISAKNGDGYTELEKAVARLAGTENFNPSEGILANERQRTAVINAKQSLQNALDALNMGLTFDAAEVDLENAIESVCELTGERVSEVVVGNVFHNFCVGK